MSGHGHEEMRAAYTASSTPTAEDEIARWMTRLENSFDQLIAMLEQQNAATREAPVCDRGSRVDMGTTTAAATAATQAPSQESGPTIKSRLTNNGPSTCGPLLQDLQRSFEDGATITRAYTKLSHLKQRGKPIEVHLQEVEDLMIRAKVVDSVDAQKILLLRASLDRPIRDYISNAYPPKVHDAYVECAVHAAEELQRRKQEAEQASARRTGHYQFARTYGRRVAR
ncbi:uncharacterized protein BROUX77_007639 [Berkeleyomyces rouxiae]|uniref:uncharacterized protein n=1 Tax=Berkeleyomyces rouxiae TaxID=2035830 RepID=UPI003B7AEAF5